MHDPEIIELVISASKIKGWITNAIRSIFLGKNKGGIEPNIFEAEATSITDAVESGLDIRYNSPNFEFGLKLRESGLWFAARKSYSEANALAALLDNGKGGKRSWSEFRKLAQPIVGKYNQTWLKTEYETAVRSARIASQWKGMERTLDLYPNVEYLRTRSADPREQHLKYVGIILPFNHPWWDKHTPPLDWLCKCGIKSTDKPVTPIPDNLPEVPAGLQNNPGRSGNLFSEDHPYALNARNVEAQLKREFDQQVTRMGLYYKVQTPDGNIILLHPGVEKNEMRVNVDAAVKLADSQKMNVKVRPRQKEGKQPDFEINGELADLKTLENASNLGGAIQAQIKSAAKQKAHYAILDTTKLNPSKEDIKKGLRAATQKDYNQSVREIVIIQNKQIVLIKREEIDDMSFLGKLSSFP